MNILPLINDFLNNFNKNFENNINLYELETYIVSQGDKLTKKLLIAFIEGIDLEYKFSKVRKEKYTVKETRNRILLTSIGYIDVKNSAILEMYWGLNLIKERLILLNIN